MYRHGMDSVCTYPDEPWQAMKIGWYKILCNWLVTFVHLQSMINSNKSQTKKKVNTNGSFGFFHHG